MVDVYTRCKELFSREAPRRMAYWWFDITPAIYKEKLESMTVLDCRKLKRRLARQLEPEESEGHLLIEVLAFSLATVLIVVTLFLVGRMTLKHIRENQIKSGTDAPVEEDVSEDESDPSEILPIFPKKKAKNFKSWMRGNCRPLFVHSEAQTRKQKEKTHRIEAIHNELTNEKIALWNKAREREALKKKQKLEKLQATRSNPIVFELS
ncbi:hypothetical protein KR067_008799 [Drosophila pandora]|nr:hypothetical protein KR067_008799 [Drosophila pandora]